MAFSANNIRSILHGLLINQKNSTLLRAHQEIWELKLPIPAGLVSALRESVCDACFKPPPFRCTSDISSNRGYDVMARTFLCLMT